MIEIIQGIHPGESRVLDDAMRLRHQVFVGEKRWMSLEKPDGRETDQFDTIETIHHVAIVENKVVGYQRLNSTARPHLLSEVHSYICNRDYERGDHVWEWSRYCVAPNFRVKNTFCDVGSELLIAAIEWAEMNAVQKIVLEFHPIWITRFLELGFQVMPLGLPTEFDGEPTIAVELAFDDGTVPRMRQSRKIFQPVLATRTAVPVPAALAS